MKNCIVCNKEFKHNSNRQKCCNNKICKVTYGKDYHKNYYNQNRNKFLKIQSKYQKTSIGKKKHIIQSKKYRINHKKELSIKSKKIRGTQIYKYKRKRWLNKNKEHMKKYFREYYLKNKIKKDEYSNNYMKERRKNDKLFLLSQRLRWAFYNAFRLYSKTGKIMTSKKYGIDYKAIIKHLKPFPKDLSNYNIHHIKPLHTFNFNNLKEIKEAFAPENHIIITIQEHKNIHNLIKKGVDKNV